jgi:hypothetical protein
MAALRRRIMANAPKIMVTDSWYGKPCQLRRAGGHCWYLGNLILGGPRAQDYAVLSRIQVGTSRRPVALTSNTYFAGWY